MMKKIFSLLTLLMIAMVGWTQTAQNPKLSYQAVVRDNSNKLVTNSNIDVTISVLRMDNSLQYTQSFTAVPTNRNGLISLLIGGEADWDDIDWLHSKIAVAITLPDLSVVKDTTEVNAVPLAINTMHSETVDPSALIQSNWTQVDTEDPSFIQNKPSISDTVNTILTTEGYVTATTLDGRHYLTSDSAVITTMQHDITANENNIANLTLHTTQHAIRDSVAGQIHDSISNMSAASHTHNNKALLDTYTQTEANLADAVDKKHTHENQDVLDRIDRAYSETDSAKLAGIAEGAEVNVQADWNQNTITADDYIKNKPTIPTIPTNVSAFTNDAGYLTTGAIDSLQNVQADWNQTSTTAKDYIKNKPSLFSGDYNDLTNKPSISDTVNGLLDTKGYLTSTSDVITTLQSDLSAAIGKEKTDSTTLATRIDALENAQMDCNKVKDCIKDTLSQYVTADLLCNAVKDCDFSNNTSIATLLQGLSSQISSLQNQVAAQNRKIDSLSNLPHGGDTPTDTFKCGTYKVKDVQDNEYPTVQIGSQCWMAQNLRTDVGNGVYPKKNSGSDDLDAAEQVIYGRLYTWDAVTKGASTTYPKNATDTLVHGICPAGWHVPSDAEWDTLTCYVFNSASPDYKCGDNCGAWQAQSNVNCIAKALSDTTGWNSNTSSGCNAGNSGEKSNLTGFTAVPAGGRPFGNLEDFGSYAYFWSATEGEDSKYYAWRRFLSSYVSYVDRDDDNKDYGFSVRCLRDAGIGGTPGENETGGTTPSTPATMSCDDVMQCLGDTLGKLNARITSQGAEIEELNAAVTEQGQTIETLNGTVESQGETISAQGQTITAQGNTIDSLAHIVDSLSRLPHGGTGAFTCGSTVTDHQGNVYNTLQIGNQCWTKENMRCTTSPITGASILVNPADATSSGKKAFCYDNDPANADNGYGLLYNWYAAVDTFYTGEISEIELSGHHRGICPKGWHVPSVREWTDLTSFVKSQPDYRCGETEWDIAKALASKTGWNQDEVAIHECSVGNNSEDNNATGFSALPAGYYHQSNGFVGRGDSALFWSSTSYNSYYTRDLQLSYVDGGVMENQYSSVNHGLSVRCVWDGGAGGDNTCCSELGARLDSLENVVDSLANLINNGGGDTTEVADGQPCPGAATVSDADGYTYNTVKIGSQCWTKENLRTKLGTAGDYGYPTGAGNDTVTYGRLYAWTAMMNGAQSTDYPNGSVPKDTMVRGICPEGWHVPSDAEWDMLTTYVNSVAEYKCGGTNNYIANALSASTGWTDTVACCAGYSSATINKTGFSAVPAGKYYSEFDFFGNGAFFWSATENGGSALRRRLLCQYTDVDGSQENKNAGLSVRCLRDAGIGGDTPDTPGGGEPAIVDTVICYPNLGSNVPEKKTVTRGENIDLSTVAFTHPVETNWEIAGWNTKADGTGTSYANTLTTNDNLTLYAQWRTWCTGTPNTSVNEVGNSRIDSLTDIDNNKYAVVQIGNQCWMKQNLRTSSESTTVKSGIYTPTTEEFPNYNVETYGRLYDWAATMQVTNANATSYTAGDKHRGICPAGWHVPSNAEWTQLTDYVKSKTEYRCEGTDNAIAKALSDTTGWKSNASSECNAGNKGDKSNLTGFAAVPAGDVINSNFGGFGYDVFFWSATQAEVVNDYAMYRSLDSYYSYVVGDIDSKANCFSVRCLRDAGIGGDTPDTPGGGETPGSDEPDEPTTFTCGTDKVKDVQDNEYPTVQIGSQCWMKENLRTNVDGSVYPNKKNDGTEDLDAAEQVIYGRLYTWTAVTKGASTNYPAVSTDTIVHGICPAGWHVPSDAEWDTLTNYVNSVAEYRCGGANNYIANALSASTGWTDTDACCAGYSSATINKTGFSAVPAGKYYSEFHFFGNGAFFWSATENGGSALRRRLFCQYTDVDGYQENKNAGLSVRCLRD